MTDAREVLAEIQQRADAAAPGPWEQYDGNEGGWGASLCVANDAFHNPPGDDEDWPAVNVFVECGTKGDAEFIAHARTDVPRLVAALTAVLKEADEIEAGQKLALRVGARPYQPDMRRMRRLITEALT